MYRLPRRGAYRMSGKNGNIRLRCRPSPNPPRHAVRPPALVEPDLPRRASPMQMSSEPPIPLVTRSGRQAARLNGVRAVLGRAAKLADGGAPSAASARQSRRLQRVKRTLVAEAGGCCRVCSYDRCILNLHFHHVDPASKSFAISMGTGKSIAAYRGEIQKCVLVCANCHGEIEAEMIAVPLASHAPAPQES
jgi:hypothetical protein